MATEERVSRLEGAYEHLATKAKMQVGFSEIRRAFDSVARDVAELKASVARIEELLKGSHAPIGASFQPPRLA